MQKQPEVIDIETKQIKEILRMAELGLEKCLALPREISELEDSHTGGCLRASRFGVPFVSAIVGRVRLDFVLEYYSSGQERDARLHAHILADSSKFNKSSAQSRYGFRGRCGGAINAGNGYIFSFSGLPEIWNEALMLFVACRLRYVSFEEAEAIGKATGSFECFEMIY